MLELIKTPLFSITLSLLSFEIGTLIYKKTRIAVFNPLLISQTLIIIFLLTFKISYEDYSKGGEMISFFLAPATVVLSVPLYKKLKLLKENAMPILIGITAGSLMGMISIAFMAKLFKLDKVINESLIPKSVTTPIGMEISRQLGGIPAVTVAAIVLTGIIGAIIGPAVLKFCKIKDKVAIGIAFGTASHAIGTTKAIEIGETEGAMSGLAIGLAGIVTVVLAPVIVKALEFIRFF